MSFERLAAELKNQGCDLRTEEAKREEGEACSPCPSQLHWAMSKIPKEYLERVLELLDQMVAEEHKKLFGEKCLLEYSIDSTDDTCTTLKETMVAMRVELHHQTVKYNVLARLVTNTIVAVCASKNTKDARPLLQYVPPGSPVYMDAEYDVEYNYQYSQERRITIRVYPKLYGEKPYKGKHRRRQKKFSKEKYRRRKLVESPIGKSRPGWKHAELPKARHAEEGASTKVRCPQHPLAV
ncbi:MAG: hypothetical protein ACUVXA_05025 [Candidatus Jordarchaeum sp.]|uniref:hypothetical protein n=1 Tax=Candidatus Jordarchaeum sp. TaxID=2823881 RepID=UPI0040491CB2